MHALTLYLMPTPSQPLTLDLAWSDSTRARLATLTHPQRRRQFALGRLALLTAASKTLGRAVALDDLVEKTDDAPVFASAPQLFTSLSHSGDWVAALVAEQACGVDIEMPRPRNWAALGKQAYSAGDLGWLLAASDGFTMQHRFYTLWTLREAAFKGGHREHVYGPPDTIPTGTTMAFGEHGDLHWAVSASAPLRVSVQTLSLDDYLAAVIA